MVINRFSREVAPAKFNPLTAEEIMKVPLLKGDIEQKQLQKIEDTRLEMLNQDIAPGDRERIGAEQSRLGDGLDKLVGDITTNGVGYRTNEKMNSFIKDYNTSTSKSGIIGSAAEFEKSRVTRKKEDRDLAIKRGYNMQDWETLYTQHEGRQTSAPGEDGITKTEFNNINLPTRIAPANMLRDAYKFIGQYQKRDAAGNTLTSNKQNLVSAIDQILGEYDSNEGFRQTMTDLGKSREDLARELANEASMMVNQSSMAVLPFKKGSSKSSLTAAAKQAASDRKGKEPIYNTQDGGISEGNTLYKSDRELRELEATAGESPEAREAFMKARSFREEFDKGFNEGEGKIIKDELDAYSAIVSSGFNNVSEYESEQDAKEDAADRNGSSISVIPSFLPGRPTPFIDADEGTRQFIVARTDGADGKPKWGVVNTATPSLSGFKEANDLYNKKYEEYSAADSIHTSRLWMSPASDSRGSGATSNDATLKNVSSKIDDVVIRGSADMDVSMVKRTYDETKDGKTTVQDETESFYNDDKSVNEEQASIIKRKLKTLKPSDITSRKFAIASDTQPASVQVTFSVEEKRGDEIVDVLYTVNLDVKNEGLTSSGALNAGGNLFESLGETQQGEKLSVTNKKNYKYQNIYASAGPQNYINSPEIEQHLASDNTSLSNSLKANGAKLAVIKTDDGYTLQLDKYSGGKPGEVTYKDAAGRYESAEDILKKNVVLAKHLQRKFVHAVDTKGLPAIERERLLIEYVNKMMVSTDALEGKDKSELFSIITESKI